MKLYGCALTFVLLVTCPGLAQGRPIPPGVRQADATEEQTEKNIPPPPLPRAHVDLEHIRQEADELAKVAQTIPGDIASVQNGVLPGDVMQKLKRIEKLSKNLRVALNP